MITAVDSSIILDILSGSPRHLESSRALFRKCFLDGKLVMCPVVWAEIRPFFDSDREMEGVMEKMSLHFDDFGRAVSSRAGELWKRYRKERGSRERLLSDFIIGAHALLKTDRLLTRDRGFYRPYFRGLVVLEP